MADIFEPLDRKTSWIPIWICYAVLFMMGIQTTIFYASIWPYLREIDPSANLSFIGKTVAGFCFGQAISSWLLGYLYQKSAAIRSLTSIGLTSTLLGNLLYFYLPQITVNGRWYLLSTRFLVGFGSGTVAILRAYVSTASCPKDRSKAVSLCTAAFTLGVSIGPFMQAIFVPLKAVAILNSMFILNVYTTPALVMAFLTIVAIFLFHRCFVENYAGIMKVQKTGQRAVAVIPKFDKVAAFVCIYVWCLIFCILTGTEINLTPLTKALYNWTDKEAIFYNGALVCVSSLLAFMNYLLLAYTNISKIDRTKMILVCLLLVLLYLILVFPLPFYDGPLDFIPTDSNITSAEDIAKLGGCLPKYTWCSYTTRVPLSIFVIAFIVVFGFALPYSFVTIGILYSEILGPRKQGLMQGILQLCSSISRGLISVVVSSIFEWSGYKWISIINATIVLIGIFLLLVFYKRMIPLKVVPKVGVATTYKSGLFYRL